jgi:hypothetical protein
MDINLSSLIRDRYLRVLDNIHQVLHSSGRSSDSVRVVVVTKGHPVNTIATVIQAGAHLLGENYTDEAVEKMQALEGTSRLEWHMIGHIQSRKARQVCQYFDWVHSLDSLKLAKRLDQFMGESSRKLPVLLECNVSGEATKYGYPAWDTSQWPALADEISAILEFTNLTIRGLMTMAPYAADAQASRPYFQRLKKLSEYLANRLPGSELLELSMGMSGDYEVALQEGATMVRIGEAILGPRPG